jgi:hypothetical protein
MSLSHTGQAARPRKALHLTALLVVTNFLVVFDGHPADRAAKL